VPLTTPNWGFDQASLPFNSIQKCMKGKKRIIMVLITLSGEDFHLLGYDIMWIGMWVPTFWRISI
jgi:hypothetical protein